MNDPIYIHVPHSKLTGIFANVGFWLDVWDLTVDPRRRTTREARRVPFKIDDIESYMQIEIVSKLTGLSNEIKVCFSVPNLFEFRALFKYVGDNKWDRENYLGAALEYTPDKTAEEIEHHLMMFRLTLAEMPVTLIH